MLTRQIEHYTGVDHTLNRNIGPEVKVLRVAEWHLGSNRRKDSRRINTSRKSGFKIFGATFGGWFYRLCHTYDYAWIFPAFIKGLRLIRQERVDIILSSYPNQDVVIVGLLLKLVTGKRWVVDYRDLTRSYPWPNALYRNGNALRLAVEKTLDRIIVSKADIITVVGKRMRQDVIDVFGPKLRGKIHVVYNGYDPDDFNFAGKEPKKEHPEIFDGTFVITYLGSWTTLDTPEYFLRALGSLLRKRKDLCSMIRFVHIGEVRYDSELMRQIPRWIQEENLNNVVDDLPHLPHSEALSWLKASSVALLVQNEIKECPGAADHCLPTKGFEYLAARKPVLALAPLKGEVAELIRTCEAGEVVPPKNVNAIEKAIYSMYKAYKNGTLSRNMNVSVIKKFERRRQTEVLARVLDSLLMK